VVYLVSMLEQIFHPCLVCGAMITKKSYESFLRYKGRKFCCNDHAKEYFAKNELGWFSYGSNTIVKKNEDEDLPPLLMTQSELKEFYESVPELSEY